MKTINRFKSIYYYLVLIALQISLQACEPLIEVDSPNNQINHQDVYKDISTTKSALSYLYSRVRDTPLLAKNASGVGYSLSLYTDELDYVGMSSNDFYINNITSSSNQTAQWWDNSYKTIYAINAFVEGLSQSEYIQEQDKKPLLGEALTLRAIFYIHLTQLYGDIPYTISTDYKYNNTIGKTTYLDVLNLVNHDLKTAENFLDYNYRNNERFFFNKTVVELLLAQNYLLLKQYDLAELYSQKIVENSIYQLETDINNVFKKNAKSTIWQISPKLKTDITPEALTYELTRINNTSAAISQKLLSAFDSNDLRLKNWIQNTQINNNKLSRVFKYKNTSNNTDEYSIIFRLEEAYFILAESLAYQNKTDQATDILNKVLISRKANPIPNNLTKELFINKLLTESYKEFFTESGHRFFDLKRNDRLIENLTDKNNYKIYHKLFPIPESQLLINKNLLPNNQGY